MEMLRNYRTATQRRGAVPLLIMLLLIFAISAWSVLAVAQGNLGELLDAGAKRLSPEEFKQEVVQRVIVGPTASGGSIEVMYAGTGVIQGSGYDKVYEAVRLVPVSGEWTTDDNGRICTSMRISGGAGWGGVQGVTLPPRCQFWYRHDRDFFVSDSDSDRRARVLRRTIKP
jgi:hypothetical protein